MIRKYGIVIVLIIILGATDSFPQKEHTSLTGIWESIPIKSSYVEMIRFYPDKRYETVSVVASNYTYRIMHDTLLTMLESEDGNGKEVTDTSVIKTAGDTLFNFYKVEGALHRTIMIKEEGIASKDKIAGNYYWKYPGGHIALSRFTDSGKLFFRLPRIWTFGSYTTKKNVLILHSKYLGDQKKIFWVKDKMLIIKDSNGKSESLYHKVDYFVKN